MQQSEIVAVKGSRVSCEGNAAAGGHPRIYMIFGKEKELSCPYCGRRFMQEDATDHGH
ncbi:MAG TPA: zinc-finger domain-containing protein [Dongiaceae bacterium]|nr:zinc-finger domain-containing protein [Dongiaceae bacterium]